MASDNESSDLTDIESDEYAETKKKKKTTTASSGGKGGYKIRNALKVPRATTYTAQALYEQIHSCDINLEPEYQRDVVWPETKQIGIIDSIFRNFYIPPVIFAVNSFEDGSDTKTCIDGKQRLTSIHKFMDGLIPHKDPLTGEKLWYKDVQAGIKNSRARRILPDEYRKKFANKQIVCVEYQDITDSDEREIFQRVQLGMALTPSEKLQVINSPRATFIRELQTIYLKEDGWLGGDALEWDHSRGSDFRCLSQAIYCMEKISGNIKGVTMLQLEKWLSLDDPFRPDFQAKISDTYRIFAELVQDRKLNKVFKKPTKVSPVEFISIGVLVFVHKDTLTMTQLSAAIAKMREDVRAAYVDIRMNSRVIKSLLDFVKSLKMAKIAGDTGGPAGATGSMAGLKRKRIEQQGDEADEDENVDQQPKAKKKPTSVSNAKPSGSAATAPAPKPPSRVKAEPGPSPVVPTHVPKPLPNDRMAALRRAKDSIAQQQQRHSTLPRGPALPSNTPMQPSILNPQMLPSPDPFFSVLPTQATLPNVGHPSSDKHNPNNTYAISSNALNNPNMKTGDHNTGQNTIFPLPTPPPPPPPNALETSLMATMMGSTSAPPTWHDSQQQPPPPASAESRWDGVGGESFGESFRDRDRHRDWDRNQRDRERDRSYGSSSGGGGGSGRYPDHDERYGSHRRESGSNGSGRRRADEPSRGGWNI